MASRCAALVTWSRLLQIFQGPPVMEDVALCFLVFFIPAKQSAAFKKIAGLAQSVSTELYVHSFALSKIYSSSIFTS